MTHQPSEINNFRISPQLNVDDKNVCIALEVMCYDRLAVFGADQRLCLDVTG